MTPLRPVLSGAIGAFGWGVGCRGLERASWNSRLRSVNVTSAVPKHNVKIDDGPYRQWRFESKQRRRTEAALKADVAHRNVLAASPSSPATSWNCWCHP